MQNGLERVGTDLILSNEHVKYRQAGSGRSPVGTFSVFQDRIEWKDNSSAEVQMFPFANIKSQRISPPNKPKVQLQLCLHGDDQATFVFLNPQKDHNGLLQERDAFKETLQQALKAQDREKEAKAKILQDNPVVYDLYKHLVVESKLIKPNEFWSVHYKPDNKGDVGVSGGFLSSLVQSEGVNGIRLNLTMDTIQAIFRTYPAVERKHLELVPHELTEEEFWTKFFQSHYFHRERVNDMNPNDPFTDCVKMDENDMKQFLEGCRIKRQLDLGNLNEDLGILSEMREARMPMKKGSVKSLLISRCNYHSERVLSTIRDDSGPSTSHVETPAENGVANGETAGPSQFDFELESEELESIGRPNDVMISLNVDVENAANPQAYSAEIATEYRRVAAQLTSQLAASADFGQKLVESFVESPLNGEEAMDTSDALLEALPPRAMAEIRTVHTCLTELLRHFWLCFPATTPDHEEKLHRMQAALVNFKDSKVKLVEKKYGSQYVEHCMSMLDKAAE
ncbi:BSD domain-containing protein, partial [Aphelenchoides avenae]